MTTQPPEVTVTTSHDLSDWRTAHEDNVPGPELDRIRNRVAAARQRGENDALVAVVLDEASGWRERALQAEARVERVEALADWFAAAVNWNEWGIHRQIRAALRGDS